MSRIERGSMGILAREKLRLTLAVAAAAFAGALPADAQVNVTRTGDNVTVEARAANLSEVVAALERQTGVDIEIVGGDPRLVDGDFQGSLKQVLGEILRNASFVISEGDDGSHTVLRVTIFATP